MPYLLLCLFAFLVAFFKKYLSFKIAMSWWAGMRLAGVWVGSPPKFTFCLTFFQSYMLPLFFSGLLSYLVGMKRSTSRHVICMRDNSHFLHYVLISRRPRFTLWLTFLKNPSILPLGVFSCSTQKLDGAPQKNTIFCGSHPKTQNMHVKE